MTDKPNDIQLPYEVLLRIKKLSDEMQEMVKEMKSKATDTQGKSAEDIVEASIPKASEEMIEATKHMDNGERIKYLEYLFHSHFDSRFTDDYGLATKHEIEDVFDRDLTEDELLVMKIAYGNGYFRGGKDGMEKVLRGYSKE